MTVFVQDADFTLHVGDVRDVLATLPDGSVDCCVTSPPYWGLRDYGTGTWEGGDPDCDHLLPPGGGTKASGLANYPNGLNQDTIDAKVEQRRQQARETCGKCGAQRVDRQLGLEPTPEAFVENMVAVFREVRRVLADHGTLWLNLGDSYASSPPGNNPEALHRSSGLHGISSQRYRDTLTAGTNTKRNTIVGGLKPKDLVGIPWRVARALQEPYYTGRIRDERDRIWLAAIVDGEGSIALNHLRPSEKNSRNHDYFGPYLRVHNTNEALVRRCAEIAGVGSVKVHDLRRRPVFVWAVYGDAAREVLREIYPHLVAKQHEARLAYHAPGSTECHAALKLLHSGSETTADRPAPPSCLEPGWYLRSDIVWSKPNPMPESVTDRPTKAHEYVFLLSKQPRYWFDQEAVRESAIANPQGGRTVREYNGDHFKTTGERNSRYQGPNPVDGRRNVRSVWEIATQPYPEAHFATFPEELARRCILAGCPPGGVVLEPFLGSGTTALVARQQGRHTVGIELNPEYAQLAARRLQQLSLFADGAAA